ncbi:MAG: MotA/TolQ/ExbB proton channel family protein [Oscillospiraceae bacterium]|nr:MotA/TolQ/ExbB proton channel family protein [Oscillospiraceae bacterium]
MNSFQNMPLAGQIVVFAILALFVLAIILLIYVYSRYRYLIGCVSDNSPDSENRFLRYAVNSFGSAYEKYGQDVNTPAIVSDAVGAKLGGLIFCERFLNNAVSLFVTLGLFGTFLGLSLSVSNLTELISYSNTSEWLSVLDSVGGGLISALSGMGVAFYTSLVGAGCSILLTILRAVFSPQAEREKLETKLELWLDHTVAPEFTTRAAKDDASLVHQMIDGMNAAAESMKQTMADAAAAMSKTMDEGRGHLVAFNKTVNSFNQGVVDFKEVDYNLHGTVERMDVAIRDLVRAVNDLRSLIERSTR